MDQHPVPRNISGFQFHLIGDMTLRQFVYLAIGVGLAFILYKITPIPTIFKVVLSAGTGFAGFAFAFIPVQERPLDKWLIAFFKSINSPTQFLWQKSSVAPDILVRQSVVNNKPVPTSAIQAHRDARQKLETYLSTLPSQPHQTLNIREKNYIDKTLSLFDNIPIANLPHVDSQAVAPVIISADSQKPFTHSMQPASYPASSVPIRITDVSIPTAVSSVATNKSTPQQSVASIMPKSEEIKKELDRLSAEKETLMKELMKLKEEVAAEKKPQTVKPEPAKVTKPAVTARAAAAAIGIPNFPQAPNIVVGVIKDTQKRILPNIIITIKDRAGTPLRALKTGRLGQFSTATPLANDTYFLEVEDPMKRYVFDVAEIVLTGSVFPPIEVTARGEKEIMREKLTKELFGSPLM